MTMIMVNVFEAKAKLSEFIEAAAQGQRVLICKRNVPVAELRPVAATRTAPRPIGLAAGTLSVPDAFFEPLPDDMLAAFDGEPARPMLGRVAERVAERAVDGGYAAAPPSSVPRRRAALRRTRGSR